MRIAIRSVLILSSKPRVRRVPSGRRRHSLQGCGTAVCHARVGRLCLYRSPNFLIRFLISGSAPRPKVLQLFSRIDLPHSFTVAPLFPRSWRNRAGCQVRIADLPQSHSSSLNRPQTPPVRVIWERDTLASSRVLRSLLERGTGGVCRLDSAILCGRLVLDTETLHLCDDMTAITLQSYTSL